MKLDNTEGKLQTKLTQQEIHPKRTELVLNLESVEVIERHFEAIQSTITETDSLKCSLEAFKIVAKVDFTQMGACSSEVNLLLKMKAEGGVGRIRRLLEDRKPQEEITAREDQNLIKFVVESHEGRIRLQADLMQENQGEASPKQRHVRPPKIEIVCTRRVVHKLAAVSRSVYKELETVKAF